MRFAIWIPEWLIPKRLRSDLDRRSALTGKSSLSRSYLRGILTVTAEKHEPIDPAAKTD